MPRLSFSCPAAQRGARLLVAAGVALGCGPAMAQLASPDPLAPTLATDSRNPPRFEPFSPQQQAQADEPTTFAPIASGASTTGFDATNARRQPTPRRRAYSAIKQPAAAGALATAPPATDELVSTQPVAPQPSPYQAPIPPLPGDEPGAAPDDTPTGALAAASAAPPVEIGPIRQPRKRSAHPDEPTDPFEPAGLRAGAFLLYPALDLIGGYNSNPSAAPNGSGAAVYTAAPELQVKSDWSRHKLNADLRGSYTGYSPDETPTLSRPYFNGRLYGHFDVTRATRIVHDSSMLVSTDNPGSPNLQAGLTKLPLYFTYGSNLGIAHDFNRFEIKATGAYQRTSYQHSTLTDGSTVSNTDRNYDQYGATLRGSYETLPGVKPFVEVTADKRVHDTQFDSNGYMRDSKGLKGLVGTTFELRRWLTGEVAVGYARRSYDDARLAELKGMIGEASLIWNADALNTVKLNASSTLAESTIAGVSGVLSRDVSVQVDHAFRRWLIGTFKLGFGWDIYKGTTVGGTTTIDELCGCVVSVPGGTSADRVDKRYSAGVGLTYKVDRSLWIKGEFRQDWLRSNVSGVDYSASTVLLGVRLQR